MVYQALRERVKLQAHGSRRVRIGLSALASPCCVSVQRIGLVVVRQADSEEDPAGPDARNQDEKSVGTVP